MSFHSLDCWENMGLIHHCLTEVCHDSREAGCPWTPCRCLLLVESCRGFVQLCINNWKVCSAEKQSPKQDMTSVVSHHNLPAAVSGTVIMLAGPVESSRHHHQNTLGSAKKHIQKRNADIAPCTSNALRRYSFHLSPSRIWPTHYKLHLVTASAPSSAGKQRSLMQQQIHADMTPGFCLHLHQQTPMLRLWTLSSSIFCHKNSINKYIILPPFFW